jgi:hypothetical protein
MRLHLPGWTGGDAERIANRLCRVPGVENVQANALTGNVLIGFDHQTTSEQTLVAGLQGVWDELLAEQKHMQARRSMAPPRHPTIHPVESQSQPASSLLRIGVRGLLGHAVVDSLWFAAGFVGKSFGLPLAGLGPLHVLMDIAVWGIALRSGTRSSVPR